MGEGGNTEDIDYECTVAVARENYFAWKIAKGMLSGGMEIRQNKIGVGRWSRKCEEILKRIQPLFYLMMITWQLEEQWGRHLSAQVPTVHFLVAIAPDVTGKTGNKFMEGLEVAWCAEIFCRTQKIVTRWLNGWFLLTIILREIAESSLLVSMRLIRVWISFWCHTAIQLFSIVVNIQFLNGYFSPRKKKKKDWKKREENEKKLQYSLADESVMAKFIWWL